MKQTKKAMIFSTMAIVIGVGLLLIGFMLFSSIAKADKTITSFTPKKQGCEAESIPISIKGSVFVKDVAFFGVEAEPERIEVTQVKGGSSSLGIFSTDYTWKIELIDKASGNGGITDSGKNTHEGGSGLVEDKYSLQFFIPDNNCDGKVDDFEALLRYELRNDNGESSFIEKDVSFLNGRYVR